MPQNQTNEAGLALKTPAHQEHYPAVQPATRDPNMNPGQRLKELVEHRDSLESHLTLVEAHRVIKQTHRQFLGVTRAGEFWGVLSAHDITEKLSLKFGHELFGRERVEKHLMKSVLVATPDTPIPQLLELISARDQECFYEDIALVDIDRQFLGLIPMHQLVRLQTSLLIDNLKQVEAQQEELRIRNQHMENDLHMAREVQLALLPDSVPEVHAGNHKLVTEHFYEPADVVGGDFYDVFSPGEGTLAIFICDVMGHGVRSALITAILRALIEDTHPFAKDPGKVLTHINRRFQQVLSSLGEVVFATAGYGVIDLHAMRLSYSQAGHPPPLLWNSDQAAVHELELEEDSKGPALGLMADFEFTTTQTDFHCGDELLLFTDGLLEANNRNQEEFGSQRLRQDFFKLRADTQGNRTPELVEGARRFTQAQGFADDVCVLLVRCCPFAP